MPVGGRDALEPGPGFKVRVQSPGRLNGFYSDHMLQLDSGQDLFSVGKPRRDLADMKEVTAWSE